MTMRERHLRRPRWLLWSVTALLLLTAQAKAQPDFVPLVKEYSDAVVSITAEQSGAAEGGLLGQLPIPEDSPLYEYFRRFFDEAPEGGPGPHGEPGPQFRQQALGSGFVISKDGYIVTNAHVVQGDRIRVTLSDQRELTAEVVGQDIPTDIALLKVDAADLPAIEIGDSDQLEVGQWILAIGAPFGLKHTATQGIISALGRSLPGDVYVPFIQTDAAVNPGNSGGPLFSLDGKVIGMNSMIYSGTGGYMGVSFAIPINVVREVVQQLREHGKVTRGWLGVMIQEVTPELAESFGLGKPRGALVGGVLEGSPAGRAGLRPGDVIVAFNGKPVSSVDALPRMVGKTPPDTEAAMTVVREGKEREVRVRIGEMPEEATRVPEGEPPAAPEPSRLNLTVAPLPEGVAGPGVLVESVEPGPAMEAGIQPGDIIEQVAGRPIESVAQLEEIVEQLQPGRNVAVLLRRGEQPIFVAVKIPAAE